MVDAQKIPQVFLGVERPPLVSAVEYVLPRYGTRKTLNLNGLVVVVPGARAGRRFRELLLERVSQTDLRLLPPEVVTVGRLPELLYRPQKPFATDWVQQQAWADAVRSAPADIRAHVLPRAAEVAGGHSDWTTGDWLAAGRLLQRQYRELAAEGFSFDDVAREGAKLPQFPERERWEAMGAIQQRYLALLDELALWDRQTARLVAVKQHECRIDRDVLLLGTVDLGRNLRRMLDQVAGRVTALIYAPPGWQTRFDAHGCVDVGAWERAQLEIDTTRLAIVDKPMDQAMAVADYVAGQADRFTVDEVTVGCADERLVSPVQRALERRGARARWGPGRPLAESLPYRLLDAMSLWLAVDDAAAFASLARHPDIVMWLKGQGIRAGWLRELDEFRSEHVPLRVTPQTVRSQKSELARVVSMLADLRKPLEGPAALPAVWSERIVSLLQIVYGQRTFDRDAPADRMTLRGCLRLREFLAEQVSVPSRLAVACTAEEALQILLRQLRTERVPAATDPEAMEILGWLELPLDDAPLLVVAGLNEGVVPKSVTADLFLPDRLRKHLDIDDNRRRYARDAYALSVLLASSRQLYLVVGRHDEDDTPLCPSRLLFAADDEKVAHRWRWYFEQAAESDLPMPVPAQAAGPDQKFAFTIPRPDRSGEPLQRLRVTHFRSYLACPYRFYLEHVLKLKTVTDDVSELEAREFGNVMHTALDAFGRGPAKDSTDPEEITAALEAVLNQTIKKLCGASIPAAIQIQIKQMQMRLKAFARRQAEHAASGWRIEFVEVPERDVHAVITVPEGSMKITGRIDRIDRHVETGARAIWDYKTGESGKDPRAAHQSQGRWVDLQLPLYINLARVMDLAGPLSLGYINLSQRTDEIAFVLADWSAEELASAEREAENVVRKILRREFWPPADPPPKYAEDWAALCLDGVMERQSSPSWEAPFIQRELF